MLKDFIFVSAMIAFTFLGAVLVHATPSQNKLNLIDSDFPIAVGIVR